MEFLCERGADVNRGLRSSSLHYAACFGRPQIVKVMPVECSTVCTFTATSAAFGFMPLPNGGILVLSCLSVC